MRHAWVMKIPRWSYRQKFLQSYRKATLLILGGGSQTQAQVTLTCSDFATAHCRGTPVTMETLVSGGSAAVPNCTFNIAAGVSLKFKNPGNPDPCLTAGEETLRIFGDSGSRVRIEHTTIVAGDFSMQFLDTSRIHIEDSTLSVEGRLGISSGLTSNGVVLVEDSVLAAIDLGIRSFGTGSGEVTLKRADIRVIDNLEIFSEGASVKVKEGSKLAAGAAAPAEAGAPPAGAVRVSGSAT